MADPTGFLKHQRELPSRRPVPVRIRDWREVYGEGFEPGRISAQAGRCMDCGVPFCHQGCPLGNLIPEWNDLVRRDEWAAAIERLHATNNFPEFTGRLCPAPCESACVLGINSDPVTIKQVEVQIIDRAFEEGLVVPLLPARRTGRRVAVVGSGPAGLAAAQQLTRAGHDVTVYERADRIGGLLRYGIPEFKMEKRHLDRRLEQMAAEGTRFVTSCEVGVDLSADELRAGHDAVLLAGGSTVPRDLPVPGRELAGVHFAMEYLTPANRTCAGDAKGATAEAMEAMEAAEALSAAGRRVVVIGGGDTGADCLGTAHRQGATSVHQLEIMSRPPQERTDAMPWPTYPMVYRTSSAHEEGGERAFAVGTQRFLGDEHGRVRGLELREMRSVDGRLESVPGTEHTLAADLVLLAMGFVGPEPDGLLSQLGVQLDARGNVSRDEHWQTTVPGVFVAGDMGRGQSLIVWAIAEGRSAAAAIDTHLSGTTELPAPLTPSTTALR